MQKRSGSDSFFCCFFSQERLRDTVEKLTVISQHRVEALKVWLPFFMDDVLPTIATSLLSIAVHVCLVGPGAVGKLIKSYTNLSPTNTHTHVPLPTGGFPL